MPDNSKPMNSATANAVPSPLTTAPATSARAIPIDTAVMATAVDSASAAVVTNSTNAMDRCLGADACGIVGWNSPRPLKSFDIFNLRESVLGFVR